MRKGAFALAFVVAPLCASGARADICRARAEWPIATTMEVLEGATKALAAHDRPWLESQTKAGKLLFLRGGAELEVIARLSDGVVRVRPIHGSLQLFVMQGALECSP